MKAQQKRGSQGQNVAASALRRAGVSMVEKIATPVIFTRQSGKPVIVAWEEPVSGDHRGILPGGRSVLAETKTILDRNLVWSDLREHQPDRLSHHASIGRAVSLLVWVHQSGIYVMRWSADGIEGFAPYKSITPERAQVLHNETIKYLEMRMK